MIRTIFTADKATLSLQLPENYVGRQVEVIAFLLDEPLKAIASKPKKFITFDVDGSNYQFNRDELNER
jgi:hypothetical protein